MVVNIQPCFQHSIYQEMDFYERSKNELFYMIY